MKVNVKDVIVLYKSQINGPAPTLKQTLQFFMHQWQTQETIKVTCSLRFYRVLASHAVCGHWLRAAHLPRNLPDTARYRQNKKYRKRAGSGLIKLYQCEADKSDGLIFKCQTVAKEETEMKRLRTLRRDPLVMSDCWCLRVSASKLQNAVGLCPMSLTLSVQTAGAVNTSFTVHIGVSVWPQDWL